MNVITGNCSSCGVMFLACDMFIARRHGFLTPICISCEIALDRDEAIAAADEMYTDRMRNLEIGNYTEAHRPSY